MVAEEEVPGEGGTVEEVREDKVLAVEVAIVAVSVASPAITPTHVPVGRTSSFHFLSYSSQNTLHWTLWSP